MNRLLISLVWSAFAQTAVFADDNFSERECWKETDFETRHGAICEIKYQLERTFELEIRDLLERQSDLKPGEINDVVPMLFLQWAQCKYEAVIRFSQRRTDIPSRLLLAMEANRRLSDEEIIWLNDQTGFEPYIAELEKCKEEWGAAFQSYLPRSLFYDQ